MPAAPAVVRWHLLRQSSWRHLQAAVMMGDQQTEIVAHIIHAHMGLRQMGIGRQIQVGGARRSTLARTKFLTASKLMALRRSESSTATATSSCPKVSNERSTWTYSFRPRVSIRTYSIQHSFINYPGVVLHF